MSAEITEFQLEHRVDSSQLASLEAEIKTLKTQVRDALAAATKAERAATNTAEKTATVSQGLGNLRTLVNSLKQK